MGHPSRCQNTFIFRDLRRPDGASGCCENVLETVYSGLAFPGEGSARNLKISGNLNGKELGQFCSGKLIASRNRLSSRDMEVGASLAVSGHLTMRDSVDRSGQSLALPEN